MSSKHQSRLLVALAAIAFALVAVVGMPKAALAAETTSANALAQALNNGSAVQEGSAGNNPVYYEGNTVYVVGACNAGGSGLGDVRIYLDSDDINLDISSKGSITFKNECQLIIMNNVGGTGSVNLSGSGTITGGGNGYAPVQVGMVYRSSGTYSGHASISGSLAINGQN